MYKVLLLLFVLFSYSKNVCAVNDTIYYDILDEPTVKNQAVYFEVKDSASITLLGYYMTGAPKYKIEILETGNPIKEGFATYYFPTGDISSEGMYANDLKEDVWLHRHADGNIWYESKYLNGKKNGDQKVYYKGGVIKRISNYKDDEVLEDVCYTEQNKIDTCRPFATPVYFSKEDSLGQQYILQECIASKLNLKKVTSVVIKLFIRDDGKVLAHRIITPLTAASIKALDNIITNMPAWQAPTVDESAHATSIILNITIP